MFPCRSAIQKPAWIFFIGMNFLIEVIANSIENKALCVLFEELQSNKARICLPSVCAKASRYFNILNWLLCSYILSRTLIFLSVAASVSSSLAMLIFSTEVLKSLQSLPVTQYKKLVLQCSCSLRVFLFSLLSFCV